MLEAMKRVEGNSSGKTKILRQSTDQQQQNTDSTVIPSNQVQDLPSTQVPGSSNQRALEPIDPYDQMQGEEREDESMEMGRATDLRKPQSSMSYPNPVDLERSSLRSYSDLMMHMFGYLGRDIQDHVNGEVTSDTNFEQAINPIA
jgi:hypothetical protein